MPTKLENKDDRKIAASFSIERKIYEKYLLLCANRYTTASRELRLYIIKTLEKEEKNAKIKK